VIVKGRARHAIARDSNWSRRRPSRVPSSTPWGAADMRY
jgi:hypothetical protein